MNKKISLILLLSFSSNFYAAPENERCISKAIKKFIVSHKEAIITSVSITSFLLPIILTLKKQVRELEAQAEITENEYSKLLGKYPHRPFSSLYDGPL